MRRREFIALLGGAAALWPHAVRAQSTDRIRRLGVLNGGGRGDPELLSNMQTLEKSLKTLGWTAGRDLIIDTRLTDGDEPRTQALARELLATSPDVVLAIGIGPTDTLLKGTQTVPVVFARVSDPVGQGFVTNLARPGGNVTGFINFEPAMAGKWLQTLKELDPNITHVAVMGNPQTSALDNYFRSIVAASGSLAVEPIQAAVHNQDEIGQLVAMAASNPNGGLVVIADGFMISNKRTVIAQATNYRLPAIYPFRSFAAEGGLVSYTIDTDEEFRGAASYIDRILRGAKPGDLPVQAPTRFELVINLKTAKALDLTIPQTLLATADEVIE